MPIVSPDDLARNWRPAAALTNYHSVCRLLEYNLLVNFFLYHLLFFSSTRPKLGQGPTVHLKTKQLPRHPMPRRSSTRTTITIEDPPHHSPPPPLPVVLFPEDVVKLRTQWKWAAFSQFFFTFSHILAMNDVTLTVCFLISFLYLPWGPQIMGIVSFIGYRKRFDSRSQHCSAAYHAEVVVYIIIRPESIVSVAFKISTELLTSSSCTRLDNWQTALRKQYRKRDPLANPIGPEPSAGSPEPRFASAEQDSLVSNFESEPKLEGEDGEGPSEASVLLPKVETPRSTSQSIAGDDVTFASQGRRDTTHVSSPEPAREFGAIMVEEVDQRPTKDWLGLSMLEKLNSMHLLAEWQFQNPMRLRTLMKNDDEIASWVWIPEHTRRWQLYSLPCSVSNLLAMTASGMPTGSSVVSWLMRLYICFLI